jgi:uncharacterized membrane protein YfcA
MNNVPNDKEGLWSKITQWSVGRTIIVLVIFAWVMKLNIVQNLSEKFLFGVFGLAVLLEIFQLLLNTFDTRHISPKTVKKKPSERNCCEKIFWGLLMAASLGGIILLIYYILFPVGRG